METTAPHSPETEQGHRPIRAYQFGMAIVVTVSLGLGLFLLRYPTVKEQWFPDPGTAQVFIQFLFNVVIGGAIAMIYRYAETRRTERLQAHERSRDLVKAQRETLDPVMNQVPVVHRFD